MRGRGTDNLIIPASGKSLVLVLVMFLLFFAADGPLGIALDLGHLCHSEDAGCPDRDSDGLPCGPDCPCGCCPGHHTVQAIYELSFIFQAPGCSRSFEAAVETPCQKEIPSSIFRPPRS